jgi:hypothetical protein
MTHAQTEERPHEGTGKIWLSIRLEEASEGANSLNTFISDFRPKELWENKFLLFKLCRL